ncbi:MAG: hypothetical protein ACRDQF_11310 [Thermocrispum sp.]
MDLSDQASVALPRSTAAVPRAEHGLVLVERKGTAHLCSLIRQHLAADAVVTLVTLRTQLIELLRRETASREVRAKHASLFGSGPQRRLHRQ